ncbi:MAG TPA: hypothetical protein DCS13_03830 [Candidatus Margulisbacteria bacterium]|nr:MAG: hypothetical protein A2X43_13525 [Candidatus Margulisbacteria bacterium GWD2_39_127]HAR62573.1 hypothetical protein [Candidatus Margulisiibacteriota bacterium]
MFAQQLTDNDVKNIVKQKTIEHVVYERYLKSASGPVSVFGYHFDSYLDASFYSSLAIFGAIDGDRGGYGIAAIGVGFARNLAPNLVFDCKLLLGSGGGGGVPAGGGFAIEPQAGLSYEFIRNVYLETKFGVLYFPSGKYYTPIVNFGFSYRYYQLKLPY